jgi:hypothetical protein
MQRRHSAAAWLSGCVCGSSWWCCRGCCGLGCSDGGAQLEQHSVLAVASEMRQALLPVLEHAVDA